MARLRDIAKKLIRTGFIMIGNATKRGMLFLWKRMVGENGTLVIHRDLNGNIVSRSVFDSKNLNVLNGQPLDLKSIYRRPFPGGVRDYIIETVPVKNINSFRYRAAESIPLANEARRINMLKVKSSFSLREAYWKDKNGIESDKLTPDEKMLFNVFCSHQDRKLSDSHFLKLISENNAGAILEAVRESALRFDLPDLRKKISVLNENGADFFKSLDPAGADELSKLIKNADSSLSSPMALDNLNDVSPSYITPTQLCYLRCMQANPDNADLSKAKALYDKVMFWKDWETEGRDKFSFGDDVARSEYIRAAASTFNTDIIKEQAAMLFNSVFDQNSLRSKQLYPASISAIAGLASAGNQADMVLAETYQSGLLDYLSLIEEKRRVSVEYRDAVDRAGDGFLTDLGCMSIKDRLDNINKALDKAYRSEEVAFLEMQKVDKIINLVKSGAVLDSSGDIRQEVCEALAALVSGLRLAGVTGDAMKRLDASAIMNTNAMQQTMQHYSYMMDKTVVNTFQPAAVVPVQEQQQETASKEAVMVEEEHPEFSQEELNAFMRDDDDVPEHVDREMYELGVKLDNLMEQYAGQFQITEQDISHLQSYVNVDYQMERSPEQVHTFCNLMATLSVAYYKGEISADELMCLNIFAAQCPKGHGLSNSGICDKITSYWLDRFLPEQDRQNRADSNLKLSVPDPVPTPGLEVSGDMTARFPSSDSDIVFNKDKAFIDGLVKKYHAYGSFDMYCELMQPSFAAVQTWRNSASTVNSLADCMRETVAMAMAYKDKLVDSKTFLDAQPMYDGEKSDKGADIFADKVLSIYNKHNRSAGLPAGSVDKEPVRNHGVRR